MREQRQLDTHHTRREDKDEGTETAVHTPHQERTKMKDRDSWTHSIPGKRTKMRGVLVENKDS